MLRDEMQSRRWQVEHVLLREKKIGNCAGDFFCWIRNPGRCNIDADNRGIAQAVVGCDLLVYLTKILLAELEPGSAMFNREGHPRVGNCLKRPRPVSERLPCGVHCC
jgi:hypothetical protein